MRIRLSYSVIPSISVALAAGTVSASVVVNSISADTPQPPTLQASVYVVPLVPLAAENVVAYDDYPVFDIGAVATDAPVVTDADEKDFGKVLTDSVIVTESTFKVFTNPIDFDPSDDDVDPTPVTMSDSDAKTLSRPDVADAFTMSDLHYSSVGKQLTTSLATPTDAINDFTVGKVLTDSVTASETINKFDVTTAYSDSVSASEADAKVFTHGGFTDTVDMLGSNIKAINSSVDFDPSDDDVDPDPITATDAVNTLGVGKTLTDAATASDTDAKSLTRPNVTDSVTASESDSKDVSKPFSDSVGATEGIKNNPGLGKTDTATATDTITKFDPRLSKTDTATATDAVNTFAQNKALSDTVSITDVAVKNFTENVDYDRSDADADADPVTATDSPAWITGKTLTDVLSMADGITFSAAKALTDSVTATESIYTLLTLGESTYLYPDYVVASDGSGLEQIEGYHIGVGQNISRTPDTRYAVNGELGMVNGSQIFGYGFDQIKRNRGFIQHRRFSVLHGTAAINSETSMVNNAVLWGVETANVLYENYTGVIGGPGLLNEALMNTEWVTYPDQSNAGLAVNFIYTDASDRTVGGYTVNETPIL